MAGHQLTEQRSFGISSFAFIRKIANFVARRIISNRIKIPVKFLRPLSLKTHELSAL